MLANFGTGANGVQKLQRDSPPLVKDAYVDTTVKIAFLDDSRLHFVAGGGIGVEVGTLRSSSQRLCFPSSSSLLETAWICFSTESFLLNDLKELSDHARHTAPSELRCHDPDEEVRRERGQKKRDEEKPRRRRRRKKIKRKGEEEALDETRKQKEAGGNEGARDEKGRDEGIE